MEWDADDLDLPVTLRVRKFLTPLRPLRACPVMSFVAHFELFHYHANPAVVMICDSRGRRHYDKVSVRGAENSAADSTPIVVDKDAFGLTSKPQISYCRLRNSLVERARGRRPYLGRSRSKETTVADSQKMKITRRAYELWQQAGEPKDRDEEFYLQAARELNEAPQKAIMATNPSARSQGRL